MVFGMLLRAACILVCVVVQFCEWHVLSLIVGTYYSGLMLSAATVQPLYMARRDRVLHIVLRAAVLTLILV